MRNNARFRTRPLTAASLVAATLAAVIAVAGQTAASAAPAASAAGGPGHWTQVTSSGLLNISDIGLVRGADGILHVIWLKGSPTERQSIMDTPIGPGGTPQSPVTIASGLETATYPDATATPSGLDAIWNAIVSSTGPTGTFVATRPVSGGHWSPGPNVPPLPTIPFTSSSDSAATGGDGRPWVAFTGFDSLTVLHLGHPETEIATKCCVYDPGLATDGGTGTSWMAYVSEITGDEGIFVQRLSAAGTSGAAIRLPGTETLGSTIQPNQRIGITGRGRGRAGVYVAYGIGYPTYEAIDVLQLGSSKPVTVATPGGGEQIAGDTITAGPNGRLWVSWFDGNGTAPQLFVRVSGTSGLSFGPTVHVALPSGTLIIWKVYISAQAGRLDVLALLSRGNTTTFYATQVLAPR